MIALLVEIPHSDLSKVTRMVLVHVRSVVMLSTSKTSSTGMLAVLSYTTVTGGDMTAAANTIVSIFSSKINNLMPFDLLATNREEGDVRKIAGKGLRTAFWFYSNG